MIVSQWLLLFIIGFGLLSSLIAAVMNQVSRSDKLKCDDMNDDDVPIDDSSNSSHDVEQVVQAIEEEQAN